MQRALSLTHRSAEIEVVDVHVGGDLHRIIMGGIKPLPGATVLEQMHWLRDHCDGLRQLVLNEPRGGQPSLFADLVVPPCLPGADAGFIIMETMGYPLISGTNTMSTAIALLETGRVPKPQRSGSAITMSVTCYVYPDAHVCRAPAGVPTTATAVRLLSRGLMTIGETLRSVSIFGSDLLAEITETLDYHGQLGVRARVTGSGWITMISRAVIDPSDPWLPQDGLLDLLC